MVFVNDKKYACETCIKGHRSSTCNHTERPLFEIKKKGRPITQCEHCRELRKTKQVHVKCVCEGREDPSTVSHSIPAKKANRKGPPPSAAFPFGLQSLSTPTSDSEEASNVLNKVKAGQKASGSSCSCKKTSGPCNCCTLRHAPRSKRSVTPPMPRPTIGDIRATARRPSSDPGDAQELSQRLSPAEPDARELTRAHGSRTTRGSVLYNPYGHAHDAHLRTYDMRNSHEATGMRGMDGSNGYIYPVPPISFDQQQNFGAHSEPSSAWTNGERLSEDVSTMPLSYGQQPSEYQPDPFGAVNLGSVDVDAWLREMMASNNNSSTESDMSTAQQSSSSMTYSDSRTDFQALPVPQALDVSHDLAQARDPDFAQASNQFDLLPRLGIDFNDNYLGRAEQHASENMNDPHPAVDAYDPDIFSYPTTEATQEVRENADIINAVSNTFSTSAPQAMLNLQDTGSSDLQFGAMPAIVEPKPQQYAFDYLFDGYCMRPSPGLPPLTRSSSVGSHSSGRSRSSMGMNQWPHNGISDSTATVSNPWQNTVDNSSFNSMATSAEHTWNLASFSSMPEAARVWDMARVQALIEERARVPGAVGDVSVAKDGAGPTDMQPLSLN